MKGKTRIFVFIVWIVVTILFWLWWTPPIQSCITRSINETFFEQIPIILYLIYTLISLYLVVFYDGYRPKEEPMPDPDELIKKAMEQKGKKNG